MKKRICTIVTGTMIVASMLAGCGGSSDSYSKAAATSNYDYNDSYAAEEAYVDYAYEDDIYEYAEENGASYANKEVASDDELASNTNRKLIKTVNMSVETREFDKLIAAIDSKIAQLGGYAQSKNVDGNSYDSYSRRSAYIVARIPQNKLDQFVVGIEEESNITNKNESTEDVTLSYADIEARKSSLRIEQERLNELLAQSDSLETIIALESRLTEVRYEIESYESRLRTMDDQVTYSTVNLNITEVKEYKPEPVEDPTFGQRLSDAFVDSLEGAWDVIQDFVIGLIAFIPRLIVLLIILGVIGLILFGIVKLIIMIVKKVMASNYVKNKKFSMTKKADKKSSVVTAVALDTPPEHINNANDESGKDTNADTTEGM